MVVRSRFMSFILCLFLLEKLNTVSLCQKKVFSFKLLEFLQLYRFTRKREQKIEKTGNLKFYSDNPY